MYFVHTGKKSQALYRNRVTTKWKTECAVPSSLQYNDVIVAIEITWNIQNNLPKFTRVVNDGKHK